MTKQQRYTSIRITTQLRDELNKRGRRRQSYEDIIKEGMGISFAKESKQTTVDQVNPNPKSSKAGKPLKPRLQKDPEKIARIKELWDGGEHHATHIALDIGYSRQTTDAQIKRMKDSGIII
jgi:hypothetical protein